MDSIGKYYCCIDLHYDSMFLSVFLLGQINSQDHSGKYGRVHRVDSNFQLPGCVCLFHESCNLADWLCTSKLENSGNPLV